MAILHLSVLSDPEVLVSMPLKVEVAKCQQVWRGHSVDCTSDSAFILAM